MNETLGCAAWKSSATFWNAVLPGSLLALCHHSSVTGELGSAHAALAEPPPPLPDAGATGLELLFVGVVVLPEPVFLPELQAESPSAAIATTLTAAS